MKITNPFLKKLLCHIILFPFHLRYRIKIAGMKNLPENRAVLLLGNHISWIDWAILQMSCHRCIRFVMHKEIYMLDFHRWLLDLLGVIPISSKSAREGIKNIKKALKKGEIVCIFPEGTISYNSQQGTFKGGFERVLKDMEDTLIVPFYIEGIRGSVFSRSAVKDGLILRREIVVAFGKPLSRLTKKALLKQKIFHLSVEAFKESYKKSSSFKSFENKKFLDLLNAEKNEKIISLLPPRHLLNAILSFSKKIKFLCCYEKKDYMEVCKRVAREDIKYLFSNEEFLEVSVQNQKIHPLMLSSLKYIITVEKISQNIKNAFEERFKKTVYEGYSHKKTGLVCLNLPDVLETGYWKVQVGYKKESVGMPLPGRSVRIADDEGENLDFMKKGRIWIKSYICDEWILTDEEGYLDEDGFLFLSS